MKCAGGYRCLSPLMNDSEKCVHPQILFPILERIRPRRKGSVLPEGETRGRMERERNGLRVQGITKLGCICHDNSQARHMSVKRSQSRAIRPLRRHTWFGVRHKWKT